MKTIWNKYSWNLLESTEGEKKDFGITVIGLTSLSCPCIKLLGHLSHVELVYPQHKSQIPAPYSKHSFPPSPLFTNQ